METDVFPDSESPSDVKLEYLKLTTTQRTSVQMFLEKGHSVEEITNIRTLAVSTIVGHITEAMKQGTQFHSQLGA